MHTFVWELYSLHFNMNYIYIVCQKHHAFTVLCTQLDSWILRINSDRKVMSSHHSYMYLQTFHSTHLHIYTKCIVCSISTLIKSKRYYSKTWCKHVIFHYLIVSSLYPQILEAIDEPNCQRLEQPDCCPKEFYGLMLKCWEHDPKRRPTFAELRQMIPQVKKDLVQKNINLLSRWEILVYDILYTVGQDAFYIVLCSLFGKPIQKHKQ